MKRLALSIILCLFAVSAVLAQNISVKSFASDPTDLTARMNPVKDENARNCALLKIITTETGFSFQPDAMGICKEVEFHTDSAEIWVWLAPGSRRITIAHPQLGQLRNYEYPEPIEASSVYVMELTTAKITTIVEEQNKQNFLRLSVSPADALVKIDGNTVVTNDGQYAKMLPVGEHTCECFCPLYYSEKQSFTILPDEKTSLNITLKPNYGYIKVTSAPESDAAVYIDGRQVGTTPYTSNKLESKSYTVQVAKEMWQEATQQVTVADNQTSSVSFTLLPNFAEPVFTCSDAAAEIWINGEKKGTGRWSGRLPAGAYKVETQRASHATATKQLTLTAGDNSTIALAAPTPIYGKISVNSEPFDADILLDGKKVGTTPELLNDILIGSHEIKLQKQGCTSVTRTVTVREGETAEVTAELATGRQVMLKSDPTGASLYVDGSYAGTAPYSVALSFGTHTVKAVNDGVTKQETITVSENGQSEWTLNVQKGGQSCGMVKDYDGNTYATVQIGEQCWMKENLRTTHYADGTSICTPSYDVGYWYYPDNNSSNKATYGLLYNWKAVMRNSSSSSSNPSGVQGICPKGWHVPSDAEWKQLEMAVGMSQSDADYYYWRGNIAAKLCGNTGWEPSSGANAAGNTSAPNRNSSGFSALPAGDYGSSYGLFGNYAYFWSATEYSSDYAYYRNLNYDDAGVYRSHYIKSYGYSVRCVRDSENDGVTKQETITVSENGQSEWTLNVRKDGQSCSTVKDYDGNTYATVQIGEQCWMKENLRTTHYADGTSISHGNSESATTAYWYYPDNNSYNKATYGLLYNWKAVMRNSSSSSSNPSGVQGICPKGWHVPSDAEWEQLEDYVSSQKQYCCSGDTNYIAKALAATTRWYSSGDNCDVGNNPGSNNATGFSALPADIYCGRYFNFGATAGFWSSTENNSSSAYNRNLGYDHADVYRLNYVKSYGFSVRCVRNSENDGVTKQETITVSENGQSEWTLNVQKGGQSCGTVKDYDGNSYATVQIGEQCWMKENLRTTHYADGTSISHGSTHSTTTAYWYYPDDNSSNKATYGLLYNWKAVMRNSSSSSSNPSGVQGICPTGWHVPSDAEWKQLENYVGSQSKYVCDGDKDNIAKALAATTGWHSSSDNCDVGNNPSSNNATGFSALPAGGYVSIGYVNFGDDANFWSATEYNSSRAYERSLYYFHAYVNRVNYDKYNGDSVRCLRN